MATPEGDLTTAQVLTDLSGSYPDYHAVEVAFRDYWRSHSLFMPAHYTSRDFLTYCFENQKIVRSGSSFIVLEPEPPTLSWPTSLSWRPGWPALVAPGHPMHFWGFWFSTLVSTPTSA